MFTLNGVACQAVVDPVGQADEEDDGADDELLIVRLLCVCINRL